MWLRSCLALASTARGLRPWFNTLSLSAPRQIEKRWSEASSLMRMACWCTGTWVTAISAYHDCLGRSALWCAPAIWICITFTLNPFQPILVSWRWAGFCLWVPISWGRCQSAFSFENISVGGNLSLYNNQLAQQPCTFPSIQGEVEFGWPAIPHPKCGECDYSYDYWLDD